MSKYTQLRLIWFCSNGIISMGECGEHQPPVAVLDSVDRNRNCNRKCTPMDLCGNWDLHVRSIRKMETAYRYNMRFRFITVTWISFIFLSNLARSCSVHAQSGLSHAEYLRNLHIFTWAALANGREITIRRHLKLLARTHHHFSVCFANEAPQELNEVFVRCQLFC